MARYTPYKFEKKIKDEKCKLIDFYKNPIYQICIQIYENILPYFQKNCFTKILSENEYIKRSTGDINYFYKGKRTASFNLNGFIFSLFNDDYDLKITFYDNISCKIKNINFQTPYFDLSSVFTSKELTSTYIQTYNYNNYNENIIEFNIEFDQEQNVIEFIIKTTFFVYSYYGSLTCHTYISDFFQDEIELEFREFSNFDDIIKMCINFTENIIENKYEKNEDLERFYYEGIRNC